jgi:hypothetical protein
MLDLKLGLEFHSFAYRPPAGALLDESANILLDEDSNIIEED